jgi:translation initiation factor 4A
MLSQRVLKGMYEFGLACPSPAQAKLLPPIIAGKDCVCHAQPGTGKTMAYIIGVLQKIKFDQFGCQALILAPGDVVEEIVDTFIDIDYSLKDKVYACIGKISYKIDVMKLKSPEMPQVIVSTPKLIAYLLKKGIMALNYVQVLVLDKADELLSKAKVHTMEIIKSSPKNSQICVISGLSSADILEFSTAYLKEPAIVLEKNQNFIRKSIKQYYIAMRDEWRYDELLDLLNKISMLHAVLFCNTIKKVEDVADKLKKEGYTVSILHEGIKENDRSRIMKEFRCWASRILACTDIATKRDYGYSTDLVINYEIPIAQDNYISRIGRLGMHERKGFAINFVAPHEVELFNKIKECYHTQIDELPADIAAFL